MSEVQVNKQVRFLLTAKEGEETLVELEVSAFFNAIRGALLTIVAPPPPPDPPETPTFQHNDPQHDDSHA